MKLLVLDVEGTLFQTKIRLAGTVLESTIWQSIAESLGPEAVAEEVETHRKWSRGLYKSYLDWMADTIEIHRRYGLSKALFRSLIDAAEYNLGVAEALAAINRSEYQIVLVSGGFRELARRAQLDHGIRYAFAACEYMFDTAGWLAGFNLLPCDFEGKVDFIKLMLKELGLSDTDWIFVGDGLNDVPIAKTAPVSIAYGFNPTLKAASTFHISDFRELPLLLQNEEAVAQVAPAVRK